MSWFIKVPDTSFSDKWTTTILFELLDKPALLHCYSQQFCNISETIVGNYPFISLQYRLNIPHIITVLSESCKKFVHLRASQQR